MLCLRREEANEQHLTPLPSSATDSTRPVTLESFCNTEFITRADLLNRAEDMVAYLLRSKQIAEVNVIEVHVKTLEGTVHTYRLPITDCFVRSLKERIESHQGPEFDAQMLLEQAPAPAPHNAANTTPTDDLSNPSEDVEELHNSTLLHHNTTLTLCIDNGLWLKLGWCLPSRFPQIEQSNSGFEVNKRKASCLHNRSPVSYLFVEPSMKTDKQTHTISVMFGWYEGQDRSYHGKNNALFGIAPRLFGIAPPNIERYLRNEWMLLRWYIDMCDTSKSGGVVPNNKVITLEYDRAQNKLHIWIDTVWCRTVEDVKHGEEPLSWVTLGLQGVRYDLQLVRPPHNRQPPGLFSVAVIYLDGATDVFELKAGANTVSVLKQWIHEKRGPDPDAILLSSTHKEFSHDEHGNADFLPDTYPLPHDSTLTLMVDTGKWLRRKWCAFYDGGDGEVVIDKRLVSFDKGVYSSATVEPPMTATTDASFPIAVLFSLLPQILVDDGGPPLPPSKAQFGIIGGNKNSAQGMTWGSDGWCVEFFEEGYASACEYDGKIVTLEYDSTRHTLTTWVGKTLVRTTQDVVAPHPIVGTRNNGECYSLRLVRPPHGRERVTSTIGS